ncbi:hypothetical protein JOD63_001333 [Microbacterium terrae]|uniref:AbiEi antitoxin C-terminal domain-containing protein n=1 Tax=Microbacterium terrae TaxID=69369 RepID=A0A0M2H2U2_9MICO|nr:hypothetical protein [Microbacterium terrae]KJL37956.1 hypothetical protein RS81_02952 [Microbacterium terrae]MBP1077365.1 hypothetical protein [Microbacterium terrae]GLJ98975.1 hypothetical protein GCM10017594_21720 [Microbacterium terrae]
MGSPFVYFSGDRLSQAELCAARLDGDVVEVGDAYMPADAVETAAIRAGSLGELTRGILAATHLSAAWIHGALPDPPARHTLQRAVARRIHHVPTRRVVYRDVALAATDVERRGGVLVTTASRTLADLARVPDAEHRRVVGLMAEHAGPDVVDAAIVGLHRGALPHKRSAIAVLTTLGAGLRTT